ncbi:MAG: ribosome recycling factor [bacterium]
MSDAILGDLRARLDQTVEVVKKDLSSVRTGRAKPSLVQDVKVEAYGTVMTLKELATITAPDTTLIVVSPWDKGLVAAVSSGIQKSGLNIQPIVDGDTVKISIPSLTEERRHELVKLVHQKLESGKVMIRQVRTEIKEQIETQEGEAGISEDSIKSWLESMQKTIDQYMGKIEELEKDKEKELMTL